METGESRMRLGFARCGARPEAAVGTTHKAMDTTSAYRNLVMDHIRPAKYGQSVQVDGHAPAPT